MGSGFGTRSYNRSPEHNARKRERALYTAAYLAAKQTPVEIPVCCTCDEHDYPHLHESQRWPHVSIKFNARTLAEGKSKAETVPGNLSDVQKNVRASKRSRRVLQDGAYRQQTLLETP